MKLYIYITYIIHTPHTQDPLFLYRQYRTISKIGSKEHTITAFSYV